MRVTKLVSKILADQITEDSTPVEGDALDLSSVLK